MNFATTCLVPLQQASLCVDCETITATHSNCLACGSKALLNIATVLNNRRLSVLSYADRPGLLQILKARPRPRMASHRAESAVDRGLGHRKLRAAMPTPSMPESTA
jgi:hypothetical protein